MAWRNPAQGTSPRGEDSPTNSMVPWAQARLHEAVRHALAAIAADVRSGLAETVGVEAWWCEGDPASVVVTIPEEADAAYVARAIDLENVEAWADDDGSLHVGIHPWHTTKDTDQTILAVTKVLHVSYGLHATSVDAHAHPHHDEIENQNAGEINMEELTA